MGTSLRVLVAATPKHRAEAAGRLLQMGKPRLETENGLGQLVGQPGSHPGLRSWGKNSSLCARGLRGSRPVVGAWRLLIFVVPPQWTGAGGNLGQVSGGGFPGAHTSPQVCEWVASAGACWEALEQVA